MNPILKRTLTGLSIAVVVISAIVFAPKCLFAPVISVLIALAVVEYAALLKIKVPVKSVGFALSFFVGALVIGCGLWSLVRWSAIGGGQGGLWLLYIVAIVKFSDVGGFAFGLTSAKLLKGGNHKLCPSVSPGKSWEGLLGSLILSSVVSCCFLGLTHFGVGKAIAFGVVAALVGTAGDLVESKFKRWVGVKDSSAFKFTNGMGGFLDMLDSLLFAPAILLPFV